MNFLAYLLYFQPIFILSGPTSQFCYWKPYGNPEDKTEPQICGPMNLELFLQGSYMEDYVKKAATYRVRTLVA